MQHVPHITDHFGDRYNGGFFKKRAETDGQSDDMETTFRRRVVGVPSGTKIKKRTVLDYNEKRSTNPQRT